LSIDAQVSSDKTPSSSNTTPSFSTAAANELLLAFISSDNTSAPNTAVTGISGAGLTWQLVQRTNVQLGTAEIWRAFAPSPLTNVAVTAGLSQSVVTSMSVLSFTGVDTTGTNGSGAVGANKSASAPSGAPSATLITTRSNSWVLGVGNDFDNAIARTPGANQALVQQYLTSAGDTYWVQKQNSMTPLSGTSVTINDTAPTGDRYNLSIVEVLPTTAPPPPTYSISGTVSGAVLSGVTINLTGTSTGAVTTDGSGNYSFAGLSNGTYTVTPTKTGYTFTPANLSVTVSNANVSGQSLTSVAVPTYSISGAVSGSITSGATCRGTKLVPLPAYFNYVTLDNPALAQIV